MDFLRKHMRIIFIITITGFLGATFVGFGGYFFSDNLAGDLAAEVNGRKIPYKRYTYMLNNVLENLRNNKVEITNELTNQKKREVIQDLIQEEVFLIEAKKYGISVSDNELAADIQHISAFQQDGNFSREAYMQMLFRVLHTTMEDFEESRRRQITVFKLRHLIASSVQVSEPELRLEYAKANKGKMSDFENKRDVFLGELRQKKTTMIFNEWFRQLNQTVKIKVFLREFEQQS